MRRGLRIEKMYAFIVVDPQDGNEGIPGFRQKDGGMIPLVGADMAMVDKVRPMVELMAKSMGVNIELVEFTTRRHVDTIGDRPQRKPAHGEDGLQSIEELVERTVAAGGHIDGPIVAKAPSDITAAEGIAVAALPNPHMGIVTFTPILENGPAPTYAISEQGAEDVIRITGKALELLRGMRS